MFLQIFLSTAFVGAMILQQLLIKQIIQSIYLALDLYDALQYEPRIATELYCEHKPTMSPRFCNIDFELIHDGGVEIGLRTYSDQQLCIGALLPNWDQMCSGFSLSDPSLGLSLGSFALILWSY